MYLEDASYPDVLDLARVLPLFNCPHVTPIAHLHSRLRSKHKVCPALISLNSPLGLGM